MNAQSCEASRWSRRWLLKLGVAVLSMAAPLLAASQPSTSPAPGPAELRDSKQVVARLTQMRVVTGADGQEKLEDAGRVIPGDVIEYRVSYTNSGKEAVKGVLATLPIPLETEYLSKTAKPGGALVRAAVANGPFGAEPLMRAPVGKDKSEPVPYADYRTLRWTLGQLPAGGVTEVVARVRVLTQSTPVLQSTASAPR